MAIKNTTVVEINVDVESNGQQTIGELRQEFKDLQKSIGETVAGTDEYYEKLNRLAEVKGDLKDLREDINSLDPSNRFKAIQGTIEGLAGGITAAIGAVGLFTEENEALNEILVKVNSAMAILQGIQAFNDGIRSAGVLINSLFNLNATARVTAASMQGVAAATQTATTATNAWGTALKSIGIGLVLTLLPLVASAVSNLTDEVKENTLAQQQLIEVNKEAAQSAINEKVQLDILVQTASNATLSTKQRLQAVRELQETFPGYFENIRTEKDLNDQLTTAYNNASQGILAKAKATAIFNKIVENENKILELQGELEKDNQELRESKDFDSDVFGVSSDDVKDLYKKSISDAKKEIEDLQKANEVLKDTIPTIGNTTEQVKKNYELQQKAIKENLAQIKKSVDERKRIEEGLNKIIEDNFRKQFDANEQALIDLENARAKVLEVRKSTQLTPEEEERFKQAWELVLGRIKDEDKKKIIENIKRQQEELLRQSSENLSIQQGLLAGQLQKREITQKEYDRKILENQIAFDEQLLTNDILSADKRAEIQIRLSDNISKQNKQTIDDQLQVLRDSQDIAFEEINKKEQDHLVTREEAEILKREVIANNLQAEIDLRKQYGEDTNVLEKQLANERIKIAEDERKLKQATLENGLKATSTTLGKLSEVVGKQTAAGKTLAIAAATIDTYLSAVAAFRGMVSTIPGPVGIALGVAAAAAAVVAGFKSIREIAKTKVPGGSDSASAPTPASISGGSVPNAVNVGSQAVTTQLSANSINQINQQGQTVPLRAYVVETDITNSQNAVSGYQYGSTLGG